MNASSPVRLDAHIHLFEHGIVPGRTHGELDTYQNLRLLHGVGDALVIGYEGRRKFHGNNRYILGLARQRPWIQPFGFIDTNRIKITGGPQRLIDDGHRGVSIYMLEDSSALPDWPVNLLGELIRVAPVISMNATLRMLARSEQAIRHLDQAPVLISHLGGVVRADLRGTDVKEVLRPVTTLARQPNTFVKVSGLHQVDPRYPHPAARQVVEHLLGAFGVERLVWGSNFSPALGYEAASEMMALPKWLAPQLSADQRDAVLGGTLRKLFADSSPR